MCVVSDGRSKINKRTLQVLTLVSIMTDWKWQYMHVFNWLQMGCYQEGIAKDSIGGKDVTAHIFE